jgi:hypothetical protein
VDILLQEPLGLREERPGDDDSRRGSVADLVLLSLGDLDNHVRRGVVDVHLGQDGDTVVRDDNIASRADEHLVHPLRSKRRTYRLGHRMSGRNIVVLGAMIANPLGLLAENDHRLVF